MRREQERAERHMFPCEKILRRPFAEREHDFPLPDIHRGKDLLAFHPPHEREHSHQNFHSIQEYESWERRTNA